MSPAEKSVLSDLLKGLTHELNQPLASILANARAAQHLLRGRQGDSQEVRDILDDIAGQSKRVGETLKHVRGLIQQTEAPLRRLYLDEVLEEALAMVRGELAARHCSCRVQITGRLPAVLANRSQIQRVLVALIHNACEMSLAAGTALRQPRVNVRAAVVDRAVQVSVHARGAPGAGRTHKMLQEMFAKRFDALVLDLTRCRLILAAHDGELWATHRPGGAEAFHFVIPIPK
jgi:C4-dicarboxylate-specific signal transduction histidine kinase